MEKLLLNTTEACEVVGMRPTAMKALIASGEIESLKIGRARRIPAESLREWVERQRAVAAEV